MPLLAAAARTLAPLATALRRHGLADEPWSRMRLSIAGVVAYVLAFAVWWLVEDHAERVRLIVADTFFLPTFLAPALGAWWSARKAEGPSRRGWGALSLSYGILFVSSVLWLVSDFVASADDERWRIATLVPILLSYPPLIYGLLRFPVAPRTRAERLRLALDSAIGVAGTAGLLWYAVLRVRPADDLLQLVDTLVVWADVAVLATIVTILVRRPERSVRQAMRYLAAGHVLSVFGGLSETWLGLVGFAPRNSAIELIWMVSDGLLFLGTMRGGSSLAKHQHEPFDEEPALSMAIPYLGVAVAAGMLVAATRSHWQSSLGVVMGFNVAIFGLLALRQALSRRDFHRLAAERIAQEARFRSLVQHGSDVITVVGADGAMRFHGPAVARVLGYDESAWLGRPALDLVHVDDAPTAFALLGRASASPGTPVVGALRLRHRVGSWIPMEVVVTDLVADPAVAGVVLNARDVSERARLEAELRQAQKMEAVGRLAGGIAHDFNNLLAAIRGNAGLIRSATPEADQRHADAGEIELAVDRAAALTRQLLAFSKRQIVSPSVVRPNAVVETTERLLHRLLPANVTYVADLAADLWPVHADAGQLEQVVMNLVLNARDAMPDGGVVTVRTRNELVDAERARALPGLVPGDYVVLSVRDDGVGMSREVREHIFEPFFSTKSEGTGLGLSTVFGIVSQARGHVAVESAPGLGSTFVVYLPRHTAPLTVSGEHRAAAVAPGLPPDGRETILVVDDEESVRSAIRRILQRKGYTVLTAEHGADALRVLEHHEGDVHLLLTDLSMPEMDGRALMDAFRRLRPGVPVVCMSGYSQDAELRDELSRIADAFLAKPFSVDGLAGAVREALDGVAEAR